MSRRRLREPAAAERQRVARTIDVALKRTVDLITGFLLLALFSPVFVAVAMAIVVESRGPVLHRCRRVGRHGRELSMLKFRKMKREAAGPRLTVAGDERLTRVGRILARTKLDELPQLWHVVKGEMSLVGPRPEDPHFVALHEQEYREILSMKPGITGLSQLAFVDEASILGTGNPDRVYVQVLLPQKLVLDRLYAAKWSSRMDASVLWWTLLAVVLRRPVSVHRATGRLCSRRRSDGRATREPLVRAGNR